MKVLFVISCIVLYFILGRLYCELIVFPQFGNPKDYDDLYRGLKGAMRLCGLNQLDSEVILELEKDYGVEWIKVAMKLVEVIFAIELICFVIGDMRYTVRQLLIWLRG